MSAPQPNEQVVNPIKKAEKKLPKPVQETPIQPFDTKTGESQIDRIIENKDKVAGGEMIQDYYRRAKRENWSVQNMSPDEYLVRAAKAMGKKFPEEIEDWKNYPMGDPKKYAESMRQGDKFPMPWLNEVLGTQEGRTRALAAQELGLETIPVAVAEKVKELEESMSKTPENLKQAYGDLLKEAQKYKDIRDFYSNSKTTYWHATTEEALDDIEKNGYKAALGDRSKGMTKGNGVWLFPKHEDAWDFSEAKQFGNNGVTTIANVPGKLFEVTNGNLPSSTYVLPKEIEKLKAQGYVGLKGQETFFRNNTTLPEQKDVAFIFDGKDVLHRSKLKEIYEQAQKQPQEQTDPLEALKQETLKYKSADEFVKANTDSYHGGAAKHETFINGNGIDGQGVYTTTDAARAKMYGTTDVNGNVREPVVQKVRTGVINPLDENKTYVRADFPQQNPQLDKVFDYYKDGVNGMNLAIQLRGKDGSNEIVKQLGFDGIKKGKDIIAFYPEKVMSEKQLTDIYNQAHAEAKPVAPQVGKTDPRVVDYNSKPKEGTIRLYTNTKSSNIDNILKEGLKTKQRLQGYGADPSEGSVSWFETTPNLKGYGGNTIAVDVPLTTRMEKVNNTQYTVFDDLSPDNIAFIDKPLFGDYRTSDLKRLVDEYGVQKTLDVFEKSNSKNVTLEELKDTISKLENTEPQKVQPEQPIQNELKKIYHGTDKLFDEFDVNKSADGSIWFSDNSDMIKAGEAGAAGRTHLMERFIDEKKLKLGDWDTQDKLSDMQMIQEGYDGLKLYDPSTGETTYRIFDPAKLQKVQPEQPAENKLLEEDTPQVKELVNDAKKFKTFNDFVKSQDDTSDTLFRGHYGNADELTNDSFFTGEYQHAKAYTSLDEDYENEADKGRVDALKYDYNDVMHFEDYAFNNMRDIYKNKPTSFFKKIYQPYLDNWKLTDAIMQAGDEKMIKDPSDDNEVYSFIKSILKSDKPYSDISVNKIKNDLMIPLMQDYAEKQGKNILSFDGSDFYGEREYVIRDIAKLINLQHIWNKAHKK